MNADVSTGDSGRQRVSFDTTIINRFHDDPQKDLLIVRFRERYRRAITTHVQVDEIQANTDSTRRASLLAFHDSIAVVTPTADTILNVSRFNYCRTSDGVQIQQAINVIQTGKRRHPGPADPYKVNDALIARTASADGLLLIHDDVDMQRIGEVIELNEVRWAAFRRELLS